MKDPLLRGDQAPAGFAASVSGWLRLTVHRERQPGGLSQKQQARLAAIDACSSLPVALGDNDARIRTLALASPGPRWVPGPEQVAAVHGAGHSDTPLKPESLLAAIVHAAVLDIQAGHARELAHVRKGVDAAPLVANQLAFERTRADQAERALREQTVGVEATRESLFRERARRRELQSLLEAFGQPVSGAALGEATHDETPPVEAPRPKGVREHGDGFQAYWRGADGKQQQGGFTTAGEAKAHRTAEMEKVSKARSNTMPAISAAGGHDQMTPGQAAIVAETALTS